MSQIVIYGDEHQRMRDLSAYYKSQGHMTTLVSIDRWQNDLEAGDTIIFMAPAEHIAQNYRERGVNVFQIEDLFPSQQEEAEAEAPDVQAPKPRRKKAS